LRGGESRFNRRAAVGSGGAVEIPLVFAPAELAWQADMMMNDSQTTVAALKQAMNDFVAARQWHKFHRVDHLAKAVSVEAAELLELFLWLSPAEVDEAMADAAFRQAVSDELADVITFLLSLANAANIDIATAVREKMARNAAKYPAEKYQGVYRRPLKQE
jgi:NTP pyrophosphatase (non-canonical NTP hydrolase)